MEGHYAVDNSDITVRPAVWINRKSLNPTGEKIPVILSPEDILKEESSNTDSD